MDITLQQLTKNWGIPVHQSRPRVLSWVKNEFEAAGYTFNYLVRGINRGRASLIFTCEMRGETLVEANFNPTFHVNPAISS